MDITTYDELYKIQPNTNTPIKGSVLVSNPLVPESAFDRSLVYIINNYKEDGTTGLILNKPLPLTIKRLFKRYADLPDLPIFSGGPVAKDRLLFLHTLGNLIVDSKPISHGVYISQDVVSVLSYILAGNKIEGYIKFFIGYSGWGGGQLAEEVENQFWGVTEPDEEDIMGYNDELQWECMVKGLGDGYKSWLKVPERARDN